MASLKVYGATVTPSPEWGATTRQVRVIVAATSQNAARKALAGVGMHVSAGMFRDYWARTGNHAEVCAATVPGQVLWSDESGARNYCEVVAR